MMTGMSIVPWHSKKVPMKMLYIGTTNDGINNYMMHQELTRIIIMRTKTWEMNTKRA